jgi:hypothetical protein
MPLMLDYAGLDDLLLQMSAGPAEDGVWNDIIRWLVDMWASDYARTTAAREIVETTVERFSYLFDITDERLIAAWGISRGRQAGKRDAARMGGHPQSSGKEYHRGHAIAHTLGGGTDINLLPQLASVNTGAFRGLERKAVATPGALYFTYWTYGGSSSQKPIGVQQGLLVRGRPAQLRSHSNLL